MNIGLYTDCFGHLSFEELLIKCNELGIEDIELGCGNWSGAPHIDVDLLIKDSFEVVKMKELLQKYKIKISALNCSGNPLTPDKKGEENRQATDDIIGFNLDPSHLFWMGADPLSVIRELQEEIYHIHIKDIRIEKIPASKNTLLDGKPVLDFKNRSWNFCIPGNGHSEIWWSEFITLLKMYGYDGTLSIENEDYTMEAETAVTKTVQLLKKIKI